MIVFVGDVDKQRIDAYITLSGSSALDAAINCITLIKVSVSVVPENAVAYVGTGILLSCYAEIVIYKSDVADCWAAAVVQ